jgi:uncharacterized membrane protein (UPF0182 family)
MERFTKTVIGVIVAALFIVWAIAGKYVDWMWFKTLGNTAVFWVPLLTGPLAKLLVGILIFGFLILNFWLALRAFDRPRVVAVEDLWPEIPKSAVFLPGLAVCAVLAFVLASGLSLDWTVIQQFLHQVRVGTADPIFGKDLGFYLFAFPFYQQLNNLAVTVGFLGLAGSAALYLMARAVWRENGNWELWVPAKLHLTGLTILFLVAKIWGYSLGKYGLLFQESAQMTGVNYTAYHGKLFAFQALTVFLLAIIAVLVFSLFRRGAKLLIGALVSWIALSFLLFSVYPGLMQSFVVRPNEFELESAFLKNHIDFTRKAYDLERINVHPYALQTSGASQLDPTRPELEDLRLWDYRPLLSSYNQLQKIRPYYTFNDIDVDRYPSAAGQRQVMISAREFNTPGLSGQAQNWINVHMTYTHGYGIAANQVSQFSPQGQPLFIARDLPTKSSPAFPDLHVEQPGIYFGESSNQYAIVNTKNAEFDYPQGEGNITTEYKGVKGIPLGSPFNKLLMTIALGDTNFLLSSLLTEDSSILMYRNVLERARKMAPFLLFDDDPYLVVSGGKLYWIIDAYTASAYYPYAKAHERGLRYMRNPVKVLIDAYNGTVNFYVIDSTDPIIRVWSQVFPNLFQPVSSLAPDLVRHFRYPEFLMTVQRDMLRQYHMTAPRTFYEKEDYWEVPLHHQDEPFEPYYVTLKLPEAPEAEFVMMQPFSPRGNRNLVSWLVARCDGPTYGELHLYLLPKDQNIYGPAQIDSRINQDETISQLITLWNAQQSKVTWGNLLIVPIDGTILYVKPMFMESERSQQAELKKVVMVYQDQVTLGDTLEEALAGVSGVMPLSNRPPITAAPGAPSVPAPVDRKAEIIKRLEAIIRQQEQLTREQRQLLEQL